MGSSLYPKRLWISLEWILTILLTADGSGITWHEPFPIQTVSDTDLVDHLGNSTQLLEGSINASLSWNFSLSSDLKFNSLTVIFDGTIIAGVLPSGPGVQAGFEDKFDIRWMPSQRFTLIIFNVTTEVNGTFSFTVAALKGFGTVNFRSNVQVHVVDPPSNIVTSRNTTVTAPDELTLNCSADGKPKPTRTWTRLSDDTVVTMPLNITGKQDAGGYRCTVDNGVGSPLTKDVFIAVLVRPKIDYLSSDWDVCENSTVILSCNATGEPTPKITWKRVSDDEILPAVDGVYVIDSIKGNSSGRYCCTADNGVGSDSKTVNVTVRFAASIDGIINSSNTVNEGGFFNMTCQASDNPLPTNYTWINKDGLLFKESVLSFINISRAEAGQYRCEVENRCGMDGRNTYVNVYYRPNITSISLNETMVDEGDVVLLNCTADGNPEPAITWNRLSSNGAGVHVGPAEKYLNIAGKQDEGGYRCIANNGIGNAAFSDVLNITVESYHPINTVFSTNLTNNTVILTESFTLICNADANPAASYRLYRQQESLQEQSNGTYLTFVSTRTKQVTYTCIPFNDFGDGLSKTITVTVQYNPATVHLVTNATENRNCSDSLLVNFTCDASEANPPVESYQLFKSQEIVDASSKGTWIKTISSKGSHNYSCRAFHSLGNVISSNHVTVTFNVPVQVSVHVKSGNETLTEGGNVSVYCGASAGYPAPSFSWLNVNTSKLIPGQGLTFINISKEKAGDYICNASNTCGEKQSSVTTIDVQYKPANVHLSTSSRKICAGKMVILTCSAGDSNPAAENFTLYKNGLRLANVTRAKVGVFNQMLYAEGQHSYSCVTSNAIGNASSSNTIVEVEVPVQISVHVPSGSETLLEGGNVSLHCSASGYAEATVTWAKLNADDLIVSGQWLNFTFIRKEATGEYICNANNTCGKNQSSVRTIDVQYKPENVHLSTSSRKICAGKMVILTCSAGDSNPAAENFTLYKNGLRLANVTRAKVGVFNQMLYTEGQHSYSCVASNAIGNASSSNIIVEVEAPASVTVENRTIVVREGDNVTLHCLSSGFPRPNIFWVNDSNYITEAGGTLNLTNISRHSRKYNCSASNACGNDSRQVDIDVQYSAEATGRGGNYSAPEGSTKLFSCPVDGNPEPEVAWYKGTGVNGPVISNAKQLEATETGCYTCSASNLLGAKPVTITQCITVGRNCETNCMDGKECLAFGTKYFCRCPDGTTGENCGQKDTFTDEVKVGFEFTKEEFKPEYENLEDQETKKFVQKVEQAIRIEMNGIGLNRVVVTKLRSGSVIADVELKFNRSVGKGTIKELIDEALKDNKLGEIDVGRFNTDGFIPVPEEPIPVTPTSTGQPNGGGVVSVVLVGVVVIWWCI